MECQLLFLSSHRSLFSKLFFGAGTFLEEKNVPLSLRTCTISTKNLIFDKVFHFLFFKMTRYFKNIPYPKNIDLINFLLTYPSWITNKLGKKDGPRSGTSVISRLSRSKSQKTEKEAWKDITKRLSHDYQDMWENSSTGYKPSRRRRLLRTLSENSHRTFRRSDSFFTSDKHFYKTQKIKPQRRKSKRDETMNGPLFFVKFTFTYISSVLKITKIQNM